MLKGKEKQHASKSPRCELLGGFPEGRSTQLGPPPLTPNKLWVKPTKCILLALRVCSFDLRARAPPASEAVEGSWAVACASPSHVRAGKDAQQTPPPLPLISFLHLPRPQWDAAPYRHKWRPERAGETRPWAGPACSPLGGFRGRGCQPLPDGAAPCPCPSSAPSSHRALLEGESPCPHPRQLPAAFKPRLPGAGDAHKRPALPASLRAPRPVRLPSLARALCLERCWLLPSLDDGPSPAHPPRLPESLLPLQLPSHASDKLLHPPFHL